MLGILVFIADMICLYKGNAELDLGIVPSKWIEWYHYLRLIFTFFVVIWTTVLLEHWKRVEKNFSIRFGQEDFKDQETDRANFHGKYKRNLEINVYNQKVYADWKRRIKTTLGFFVSFILVFLSVAATLGIMILKTYMSN